jgi:hypothetical protein
MDKVLNFTPDSKYTGAVLNFTPALHTQFMKWLNIKTKLNSVNLTYDYPDYCHK